MIKVEQDMLILDSSFTKQDVQAINEYVAIVEKRLKYEIVKKIRRVEHHGMTHSEKCLPRHYLVEDIIEQITGEKQND